MNNNTKKRDIRFKALIDRLAAKNQTMAAASNHGFSVVMQEVVKKRIKVLKRQQQEQQQEKDEAISNHQPAVKRPSTPCRPRLAQNLPARAAVGKRRDSLCLESSHSAQAKQMARHKTGTAQFLLLSPSEARRSGSSSFLNQLSVAERTTTMDSSRSKCSSTCVSFAASSVQKDNMTNSRKSSPSASMKKQNYQKQRGSKKSLSPYGLEPHSSLPVLPVMTSTASIMTQNRKIKLPSMVHSGSASHCLSPKQLHMGGQHQKPPMLLTTKSRKKPSRNSQANLSAAFRIRTQQPELTCVSPSATLALPAIHTPSHHDNTRKRKSQAKNSKCLADSMNFKIEIGQLK